MTDLTRRGFAALALGGGAGLLGGCGALDIVTREAPQLYTLTPKSTFGAGLPTVRWQLLVEPPSASAGLDTARIALARSPLTVEYYADVQWTARAPVMVQTLLIESFENSGKIISIGRETAALRADYLLKTELREFQVERFDEAANPRVRVHLNTKLVRMPQRVIVAGANFSTVMQAPDNQFDHIVATFDEGLGKVLQETVVWTLKTGEDDWLNRSDPD